MRNVTVKQLGLFFLFFQKEIFFFYNKPSKIFPIIALLSLLNEWTAEDSL